MTKSCDFYEVYGEVEGHLHDWYYHERILMGTTTDGTFVRATVLASVTNTKGIVFCCEKCCWACNFDTEINFEAMGFKRVNT